MAEPGRTGWVERAAWLPGGLLIAVVCLVDLGGSDPVPCLEFNDEQAGGTIRWLPLGPSRWLVSMSRPDGRAAPSAALIWDSHKSEYVLAPAELASVTQSPDELAVEELVGLDDEQRREVVEFLAAAPGEHAVELTRPLGAALRALRDQLRTPWPTGEVRAEIEHAVRLDAAVSIDNRAFWLSGWVHDGEPEMASLHFVTPEGLTLEPEPAAVSFHLRPDVDAAFAGLDPRPNRGFHTYLEVPLGSACPDGWLAVARMHDGATVEATCRTQVERGREQTIGRVMHAVQQPSTTDEQLAEQVLPCLHALHAAEAATVSEIRVFGDVAETPEHSIVVPLRHLDRVEHQLVQFAADPEVGRSELTFVVPVDLAPRFRELAPGWSEHLRVAFRLAEISAATVSLARATNLGGMVARGDTLVVLSGDALPRQPGWLGALTACLNRHADLGAVSPRLLFSDGSIAHAGGEYRHVDGRWEVFVPHRGLSDLLPGMAGEHPAQLLPDACLMVSRSWWASIGGFQEDYVGGGDPAAGLCLELARRDLACRVADVDMYWLERPQPWTRLTSPEAQQLDDWILERRWGAMLRQRRDHAARAPAAALAARRGRRDDSRIPSLILENVAHNPGPGSAFLEASVNIPRGAHEIESYGGTYAFTVQGWAVARSGRPLHIEIRDGARVLARTETQIPRADVMARHPTLHTFPGFQAVVGTLGLPRRFSVDVVAVSEEGDEVTLSTLVGRRPPLPAFPQAASQPVVITTLGRSGSSWLTLLLAEHPEIVAYRPLQNDTRLASYWIAALASMAQPASYLQALRPEIYPGHWWLGDARPDPLPLRLPEPHMPRWLGSANLDAVASFCRAQIDSFYSELAAEQSGTVPRYFAEKLWPDQPVRQLLGELYPEARELLLVRDFRDMASSIIAFNAKRQRLSFGREQTDSDPAMIRLLGEQARDLVTLARCRGSQTLIVRYESLALEPEHTLLEIFAHLGVENGGAAVRRVISLARRRLTDAQRAHQTSPSPRASVGRWRGDLTPSCLAACEEAFGESLEYFGYEPSARPLLRPAREGTTRA